MGNCGQTNHSYYPCTGPAAEPHTCPKMSEVFEDDETLCNCCEGCVNFCADEV